ncbi:MAG: hypothetical protein ACI9IA_001379 [Enterobacterales bacterium]|jgi:hypothetical protein
MATPLSTINTIKVLNPSLTHSNNPLSSALETVNRGKDNHFNASKSFAVFNDILQKTYQKMVFNPEKPTENPANSAAKADLSDYQSVDKISSQQAADTILNFIKQRVTLDKLEGADVQALTERLEQGQQSFIKGFNEAKQIIDDLGLLTPELLQEIDDTYRLVTEGLALFKEDILNQQ